MGFKNWVCQYALRWNKILAGLAIFMVFATIAGNFVGVETPPEAYWLTVGLIIGGYVTVMTQPDPSKSELLEYVEKQLEADGK